MAVTHKLVPPRGKKDPKKKKTGKTITGNTERSDKGTPGSPKKSQQGKGGGRVPRRTVEIQKSPGGSVRKVVVPPPGFAKRDELKREFEGATVTPTLMGTASDERNAILVCELREVMAKLREV